MTEVQQAPRPAKETRRPFIMRSERSLSPEATLGAQFMNNMVATLDRTLKKPVPTRDTAVADMLAEQFPASMASAQKAVLATKLGEIVAPEVRAYIATKKHVEIDRAAQNGLEAALVLFMQEAIKDPKIAVILRKSGGMDAFTAGFGSGQGNEALLLAKLSTLSSSNDSSWQKFVENSRQFVSNYWDVVNEPLASHLYAKAA